jgi:hypothetical protein
MTTIKHSKYKNTGILFELLVRQTTSDTLSGKDSPALSIIKKYFNKTELSKEYKIYQTLINSKLNETKANILIDTVLNVGSKLNRFTLRKEKYNLIKEIKNHYNLEDFFKAKINNYKEYASIYTLLEAQSSPSFIVPQQIIDNKITLLENMSKTSINKEEVKDKVFEEYFKLDKGTRMLAYKILLEKFNSKYSDLNLSQKNILKEFINNITNTVKLREFVNKEYNNLKIELTSLSKQVNEPTIQIKLNEVISLIKPFEKNKNVKDEDIIALLQYAQLLNELKEIK